MASDPGELSHRMCQLLSARIGEWGRVRMCAQFPLHSGIDGTNKPPDIQSTESWYAESEDSEAD